MNPDALLMLPLWYVVFLLSITCHEAAHAWAARLGGDSTAYEGGQVSLNPLPHIRREPWGTVLIPLITYMWAGWMMGWASAPYDPNWEDRHPRRAAAMAAAGPAANLLLAIVGFAILRWGLGTGAWVPAETLALDGLVQAPPGGSDALVGLGRFASLLFLLNLLLCAFNLLPVHPLDGASVLAGLAAPLRRMRDAMRDSPSAGLIGILLAWVVFREIVPFVFGPALALLFG